MMRSRSGDTPTEWHHQGRHRDSARIRSRHRARGRRRGRRCAAQGQLSHARLRCAALRHHDRGLRHGHFGVRQHPDRRAVRHRVQIMGRAFPMIYYFVRVSLGAFTKGLGFGDLRPNLIALAVFIPVLRRSVFCFCASRSGEAPRMCMVANIFWLGTKEIRSFLRDFVMLGLVIYTFSLAISRSRRATRRNCTTRHRGGLPPPWSPLRPGCRSFSVWTCIVRAAISAFFESASTERSLRAFASLASSDSWSDTTR
jgi:hypothetical protein